MPDFSTLQALSQGSLILIMGFQFQLYREFRAIGERLSRLEGKLETK